MFNIKNHIMLMTLLATITSSLTSPQLHPQPTLPSTSQRSTPLPPTPGNYSPYSLLSSCKGRPDSDIQPAAFIRPLCCLLSDPFSRNVALNTPLQRAASSTVACTFCAYMRCNKALVYKKRRWTRGLCMQMHANLFTFDQN